MVSQISCVSMDLFCKGDNDCDGEPDGDSDLDLAELFEYEPLNGDDLKDRINITGICRIKLFFYRVGDKPLILYAGVTNETFASPSSMNVLSTESSKNSIHKVG